MDSPPPKPPPQKSPFQVLPRRSELSSQNIQFLDQDIVTHQDLLTRAPLLLSDLTKECSNFDSHLLNLRRKLTKLAVSWISRSFSAKSSLSNVNFLLENLSLQTSQYGIGSWKVGKVLVEEIPKLVKQVQRIENIRKYIDTALQLEALVGDLEDGVFCVSGLHARNLFSEKLRTSLKSIDFGPKQERILEAIKTMNNIEEVLVYIEKFQAQWHRLLESVDARVDKILVVVRPQVLADHRALLASLGWPPKLLTPKIDSGEIAGLSYPRVLMQGDKSKGYSQTFLALCSLQHLQRRREDRQHNIIGQRKSCVGLWAIDELVSPIASRMEYHFSKWAEQPEFMFALVYKITKDFIIGVDDVLQPLIDKAMLSSCSAKEAWVSAMVQMLSGFLAKSVFSVLVERYRDKQIRSEVIASWLHLIDHTVSFDKQMRSLLSSETPFFLEESKNFEGLSRGLSVLTIFCDRPEWLKIWAKIELKDAWKKIQPLLKDERAWIIDKECDVIGTESKHFVLSTRGDHKAPLVAESALKIAWEMIERSQTLPSLQPRIRFIRSTAARFFWYFLNGLILRCKNTDFSLENVDASIIKVCGSINAARYIESKMQEWSDDVSFLEMRIAEKDSDIDRNNEVLGNSCFFGEEIKSLEELMTNWLMEIISALLHHFETLSWEYLQNGRYFVQENLHRVPAVTDLAVSFDIVQALDALKSQLHLLKMSLNPKDFLDLWRSVADALDQFVSRSIFTSGIRYSSGEINQFDSDMQALFHVFQPFCYRPDAFFPCIREILKLLQMSKEEAKLLQVALFKDKNGTKCLHSLGISHLTFDQVDNVLSNRKCRS
ncbi:RAD50-INTERACTING PROTEIN 1 RINT-1 [Salix purpurea]|uniref:RAD50-INTERACTING PROTEIN 1 RINT-1 n=1 Tax=Salix purpurea TaxID=77065 RepID=A0A9Q0PNY5_SALPP|nr:RAD50-INTERACTING PROTEIN 1 RINT-1 [Salix purpurea]